MYGAHLEFAIRKLRLRLVELIPRPAINLHFSITFLGCRPMSLFTGPRLILSPTKSEPSTSSTTLSSVRMQKPDLFNNCESLPRTKRRYPSPISAPTPATVPTPMPTFAPVDIVSGLSSLPCVAVLAELRTDAGVETVLLGSVVANIVEENGSEVGSWLEIVD